MTVLNEDVLGWSRGVPPTPSTVSVTWPRFNTTGTARDRAVSTMIPSRRKVLKPLLVASSMYTPDGSNWNWKFPEESDAIVSEAPEPVFINRMFAPTIAGPDQS